MLMVLLCVQVGLLVRDQILLAHSARSAAVSAAVFNNQSQAVDAARASTQLDPSRLQVSITPVGLGGDVEVRVEYRSPIRISPFTLVLDEVRMTEVFITKAEQGGDMYGQSP